MTMCQSVISIESSSTSRCIIASQASEMSMRFAVMNGRSSGVEPGDGEVFEHELAGEKSDAEPADAHRPAHALRPFALGEAAQPWTEIDGQRRHDRHRERHRQRGDTEPRKAEREVRSDALEALEPKRHS